MQQQHEDANKYFLLRVCWKDRSRDTCDVSARLLDGGDVEEETDAPQSQLLTSGCRDTEAPVQPTVHWM